jgi:hypothetical protein
MNDQGWSVHPLLTLMPLCEHAPENWLELQALTRIVIDDKEDLSARIDALRKLADAEDASIRLWDAAQFTLGLVKVLELTARHILIAEVRIRYSLREAGIKITDREPGHPARYCAAKFMNGSNFMSLDSYAHVSAARDIAGLVLDLESMSATELATLGEEAAMIAIRMLFLHVQCISARGSKDMVPGRARDYLSHTGRNLWRALDQGVTAVTRQTVREYENRYGLGAFNQVMHRLPLENELSTSEARATPDDGKPHPLDKKDQSAPVISAELVVIKEPIPPATDSGDQQMIKRFSMLCKPSSVAVMPSAEWLEVRRNRLLAEFPWALMAIDILFDELIARRRFGAVEISFPPMLLLGPPGVGKSRLVRRIAEELSLPFLPLSLAGMDDSRTFLGTARGWSSGQPSALLQLMLTHKSASGLVLLDEIEKATNRSLNSASTTSMLLTLLEIETATRWFDSFLQVPCDLSRLNFIGTANGLTGISAPLLNRLNIVYLGTPKNSDLMSAIPYVLDDIAKEMRVPRDVLPNLQPSDLIASASTMRELRARVSATLRVWARRNLGLGRLH